MESIIICTCTQNKDGWYWKFPTSIIVWLTSQLLLWYNTCQEKRIFDLIFMVIWAYTTTSRSVLEQYPRLLPFTILTIRESLMVMIWLLPTKIIMILTITYPWCRMHVAMKQPQKTGNCDLIGLHENKTADTAQPRKHSIVTRPFPYERMGSGDKTTVYSGLLDFLIRLLKLIVHLVLT